MTKVLIAPGLGSSGPIHWQTIWEQEHPEYRRIEQYNWNAPQRSEWVKKIEEEVLRAGQNTVIVAHSLACIALAFWAAETKLNIKSALLVAPPDTERADFPSNATGFSPLPLNKLPFKTILIASSTDEYIQIDRCKFLADKWQSHFVNIGPKGHINSASGLNNWEEGKVFLKQLI